MPSGGGTCNCGTGAAGSSTRTGEVVGRFVRDSHVFAAAIREILEIELLREASPLPLTPGQFHLVKLMSLNGRRQIGEVADLLGVTPPAATKNIDKLEQLGLVVRMSSKTDRRATLLSVSPKGRRLVRKYEQLREARLKPIVEGLSAEEVERFAGLLERFSVSLLPSESPGDKFCLYCAGNSDRGCPVNQVYGNCRYHRTDGADCGEGAAMEASEPAG